MLSILIPTYDYTCYKLVFDLHKQAEALSIPYEIIVAEDGSRSQVCIIANHKICELPNCRHIIRKENVGRAAIRNFLITEAKGDVLLFMDADGKVVRNDFIARYWEAGKTHDVVCGGIKTPDVWRDPTRMLRWKYEKAYEQRHGYISTQFRSFCFLISRRVSENVKFDERYQEYGYEDVQYGKDLAAAGFNVFAIDNPLENTDIETNKVFLKKTEAALRTASKFQEDIGDLVVVTATYQKYKIFGWAMRIFFSLFRNSMQRNLFSANPSLMVFRLYKLCYFSYLQKWANSPSHLS